MTIGPELRKQGQVRSIASFDFETTAVGTTVPDVASDDKIRSVGWPPQRLEAISLRLNLLHFTLK